MKRSIAIQRPARLSIERAQLRIDNEDGAYLVPLEDLSIIVLDHDAIQVTEPVLGTLGEMRVALVACNGKHLPSALLLPYEGHTLMAQILRGQIEASKPVKKRIWQTIVRAKIHSQARLLVEKRGTDFGLGTLATKVASGDPTNQEGGAASIYFEKLFGEGFVRMRGVKVGEDTSQSDARIRIANAMLNYGYAVLRALAARSVVLSGLHPALGVHHHHRENTFSLADDLMEPLRVLVDRQVYDTLEAESVLPEELSPSLKREILKVLTAEVIWDGGLWPLDAALEAYAAGVRSCLLGERKALEVPGA